MIVDQLSADGNQTHKIAFDDRTKGKDGAVPIIHDFGTYKRFHQIDIRWQNVPAKGKAVFTAEGSADGKKWETLIKNKQVDLTKAATGDTQRYDLDDYAKARFIRITATPGPTEKEIVEETKEEGNAATMPLTNTKDPRILESSEATKVAAEVAAENEGKVREKAIAKDAAETVKKEEEAIKSQPTQDGGNLEGGQKITNDVAAKPPTEVDASRDRDTLAKQAEQYETEKEKDVETAQRESREKEDHTVIGQAGLGEETKGQETDKGLSKEKPKTEKKAKGKKAKAKKTTTTTTATTAAPVGTGEKSAK